MFSMVHASSWGKAVLCVAIVGTAIACSDSGEGDKEAIGGAEQLGSGGISTGAAPSGGTGTGGLTASGGSGASGAVTSSGGLIGTGGAMSGGTSSGGVSPSGGLGSGGAPASGGMASGGGGALPTGGVTASGGVTETGGAETGGSAETGGAETGGAETGGAETGGTVACGGHAISLAANGTGSESDSAYANVEIDMQSDLPVGNAPRTVEFWAFIRTTDWVGETNEIYYYGGSDNAGAFGLDFGTYTVSGQPSNHATLDPITGGGFNDDSTNDLGIDSSTDQWVHVAMVWDGTVLVTYVNGLPKITTHGSGATALSTASSPLVIGCNPTNQACFGGYFDELRVWNVARTAGEIEASYDKPCVGDEAGLVGYWKFDEDSGTTAADAVSAAGHTAHAGTLQADDAEHLPTFVEPSVPLPLVCP